MGARSPQADFMKPKDPIKAAVPVRRAAVYLGAVDEDGSTLVHADGALRFAHRAALLNYLTDAATYKPFGQVWLVPSSPSDWRGLVPSLLKEGYRVGATARHGVISTLRVWDAKGEVDDEDVPGHVYWHGRSAAGIVSLSPGLTAEEQCAATLAEIDAIDDMILRRFPSVTLGSSLTGTALELFRTFLDHELVVDPQLEVSLRRAGAVGGGRQELYCHPGDVVLRKGTAQGPGAEIRVCSRCGVQGAAGAACLACGSKAQRSLAVSETNRAPAGPGGHQAVRTFYGTPADVDLSSAYPTALETVPIGVAFLGEGTESQYLDPCTVVVALVRVPGLLYGPLRYEPSEAGTSCYPTGVVWGTWTGLQLKAAEAVGCVVIRVQTVYRFAPDPLFARFGEALRRWRSECDTTAESELVKALSVRAVGAFLMGPRESRLVCSEDISEDDLDGATSLGHSIYQLPVAERQHDNALLPAGIQVIGAVQAWIGLLLRGAELEGAIPLYIHTDGGAFHSEEGALAAIRWAAAHGGPPAENPESARGSAPGTPARAMALDPAAHDVRTREAVEDGVSDTDVTGDRVFDLRSAGAEEADIVSRGVQCLGSGEGEPPSVARNYRVGAWKITPLDAVTVWAPGQRHEVRSDGTTRTAGAGLSRELSAEEIVQRVATAEHLAELDRQSAGRRVWESDGKGGEKNRAPRVDEVDEEAAGKLEKLAAIILKSAEG